MIGVIVGLMFLLGAGLIAAIIPSLRLFSSIFAGLAIVIFALSILSFFIGRDLWKGKNWARVVIIVSSVIGLVMAVYFLVGGITYHSDWRGYADICNGIIGIVTDTLIGGYLMFNSKVKKYFSKDQ